MALSASIPRRSTGKATGTAARVLAGELERGRVNIAAESQPFTKSLRHPDEVVALGDGSAATVTVGDVVVGRVTLPPGWRWSEQVRPVAGTTSCQFRHVGVGISGTAGYRLDDGTEIEVTAGDVFDIPAGHDNWVIGEEPAVAIMWGGWRGFGKPPVGDRVLLTMLMTDIVGSTQTLSTVGDHLWDQTLDIHNRGVRGVLERYRATEIDTTGDGFLATVDGAARAVQAALDMHAAMREIGLQVRIGIHTGDVEMIPGGNIRGLAVHETARIMALAGAGETLVSNMTRELATGAGFAYEDYGLHQLKGITEPRHIFRVNAD
jgi:class 3 adenylate cyclase